MAAVLNLCDLNVEQVATWLSTIQLEKVLGKDFTDQQIDGDIIADGALIKRFGLWLLPFASKHRVVPRIAVFRFSDQEWSSIVVMLIQQPCKSRWGIKYLG